MEAIEFVSEIENGFIKVPKKYTESIAQQVRVILLIEAKKAKKKSGKKDPFTAFKVKTKGLNFDRDEANKR
jgi:hypothetical protein